MTVIKTIVDVAPESRAFSVCHFPTSFGMFWNLQTLPCGFWFSLLCAIRVHLGACVSLFSEPREDVTL